MIKSFTIIFLFIFQSILVKAQKSLLTDSSKQLKDIIIIYQAEKSTPITFQNLFGKDLKAKSVGQEPSFLFSETPSITVYSDAGNTQGYSYFRLRGIDQTRINISLDGVPLNEPEDQGAYFSNYPDILNSVSKLQIQRGVGTSKNGTASYGGSIQLFSPNLRDSAKTIFGLGYGSFNSIRAFGEYNSGVKNNKALYIRASEVYSDGFKYNSSNHSQSAFVSSALFLKKSTWKLNLLAGRQQNQLAWLGVSDSLIAIDRRTNANKNEKDNFIQCLAQIQNFWQPTTYSSFQSSIYYTFLKGNYDLNPDSFEPSASYGLLYNYAFQSNLVGFFSNYSFSKNNLSWTTGIHTNTYNRQHIGTEKTEGQLYSNTGYKKEFSVFSKLDYTFKKITFFADIQYRYSAFDYVGSVSLKRLSWNFINPKAGISYELKPNTVIYYSIGNTGREPTRNDIFGGNDNLLSDSSGKASTSITTPEYVVDQELGVRHASENFTLNLNLYYLNFKNEIVLQGNFGPNGLALTNNVESSIRTGLELNLGYKLGRYFSFINNSSFNYSEIREQKVAFHPILTPPLIVIQEVVCSLKDFSFAIIGRYQDQSFIDFANTSTINSYFLLNARVQYSLKKLQIAAFLNNVTYANYFNNGYVDFDGSKKYFVQAPINFNVSAKYSF